MRNTRSVLLSTLTKDVVKEVFLKLIEEKEETTSLDVKNELRKKDFYAKQEEVANFMREIASEECIDFVFNGDFRIYKKIKDGHGKMYSFGKITYDPFNRKDEDDDIDGDNDTKNKIPNDPNLWIPKVSAGVGPTPGGRLITKTKSIPDPSDRIPISNNSCVSGDWEVYAPNDIKYYFTKRLTRNQARYSYKKITGNDYKIIRANRIK